MIEAPENTSESFSRHAKPQRSLYREAVEFIRNGELGEVYLVRVFNMMPMSKHKPIQEQKVPDGSITTCGAARPPNCRTIQAVLADYWE
jgi:hypothetical protein